MKQTTALQIAIEQLDLQVKALNSLPEKSDAQDMALTLIGGLQTVLRMITPIESDLFKLAFHEGYAKACEIYKTDAKELNHELAEQFIKETFKPAQ